MTSLNLGCGPIPIKGFINIDGDQLYAEYCAKIDASFIFYDLREGLPKFIIEDSVDFINASQFLEHLNYTDGLRLLGDCFRVLKKQGEGRIRISVPDAELLINSYLQGAMGEFAGVQPKVYAYARSQMLKLGMILFGSLHEHGDSGHKMCYDFYALEEMLKGVGFKDIKRGVHDASLDAEVAENHEVIVVATT